MRARWIAWGAWGLALAITAGFITLAFLNSRNDPGLGIIASLGTLGYATTGALIVARQPRNTVGWLFLLIGLCIGFTGLAENYAQRALDLGGPGALPLVGAIAWLGSNFAIVVGFGSIPLVLLVFPAGTLPSRRWRPVAVAMVLALAAGLAGLALSPNPLGGEAKIPNPTAVPSLKGLASLLMTIGGVGSIVWGTLCVAALVVRFRRSRGAERQQLRWLAYSAGTAAVLFLSTFMVGVLDEGRLADVFFLAFLSLFMVGIPVSCGIAILKHGLFGIDIVINKTLVYGALAAFITAVYVAIVVGIGSLVGAGDEPNLGLSIAATALVAVAFQPVRAWLQRVANRLVYGERASPYEVLSGFAERVGGSYAIEDVLPRMVRVVAEGTGARRAELWLVSGERLVRTAAWPAAEDEPDPDPIAVTDNVPAIPGSDRAAPVRHRGELLGALSVAKPPGEPLRPAEAALLDHLASQAGLVVRNARLTADLQAQLEELSRQAEEIKASRQRIVAAEDAERRRLERDIHDGAQQHLVALAVKIRLARQLAAKDPERARSIVEDLRRESAAAADTLAGLARGIYPALLAEGGLVEALRTQAAAWPFDVSLEPDGVGRYPEEVEAAVYFSILEALQNVAKYAEASRVGLTLRQTDDELGFEVSDDGRGFDPATTPLGSGTRNMADRLDALGGRIRIDSAPGRGTTIRGEVPASPLVPAT